MYKTKLPGATVRSSESREFRTRTVHGISVVNVLTAEVDIANADAMRRELLGAAACSKVIVVDMSSGPFCDSSGLKVLDGIAGMLAGQGGELRAVIIHQLTLRCLLEIPIRTSQVRVFRTVHEAVFAEPRAQSPQPQAA